MDYYQRDLAWFGSEELPPGLRAVTEVRR